MIMQRLQSTLSLTRYLRLAPVLARAFAGISMSGRSYLIPTLKLKEDVATSTLTAELSAAVQRAPGVYRGSAVVLDVAGIGMDAAGLRRVVSAVCSVDMNVSGVVGVPQDLARAAGVPALLAGAGRTSASASPSSSSPSAAVANAVVSQGGAAAHAETVVIRGNVRGGQQVYGGKGGVTVLGSVNPGGEVIAEGDIHVFGALHGRALAGVTGNTRAVIVASQFNPQLVAIADVYVVCEQTPAGVLLDRPTEASLVNSELVFTSVGVAGSVR
uniref:Mitochondrial MinC n=1 Tax=Malawimonas californiana TaxID=221722 RepID=A0A0E3SU84_MALCL|nr:mitochondrial MinC [Malawimonas californiana]